MNEIKKLAHAIWECKYHLAWRPKYRFGILEGDAERSLWPDWEKLTVLASLLVSLLGDPCGVA